MNFEYNLCESNTGFKFENVSKINWIDFIGERNRFIRAIVFCIIAPMKNKSVINTVRR